VTSPPDAKHRHSPRSNLLKRLDLGQWHTMGRGSASAVAQHATFLGKIGILCESFQTVPEPRPTNESFPYFAASRATKTNLAAWESQVRRCSADMEANSVWPSKSAGSRFMNWGTPLLVSSSSCIVALFCFQFSQSTDVTNILIPNRPNATFHLNQLATRSYPDDAGSNF
jgi:hypothetical protein